MISQRSVLIGLTNPDDDDEVSHIENLVAFRATSAGPDFNLNYDKNSTILPIDIGGPDQQQKSVTSGNLTEVQFVYHLFFEGLPSSSRNPLRIRAIVSQ